MPGFRATRNQFWFMETDNEKLEYSSEGVAAYKKSQLLIEDEAIVCGMKMSKKCLVQVDEESEKDSQDDDDSSVSSISDPYDGMHKIKHAKLDLSNSSDENSSTFYPFFCDH